MAPSDSGYNFIGIDVGTSSVKAVMGGPGGALLDTYAETHKTVRPVSGAAEQDPNEWLVHVDAALAKFARHPRAGDVAGIGITSQVNTHVFCDSETAPLLPAITWQDTRPAERATFLESQIGIDAKISALGAPIPIDASHALARMAWVAATHPDVWNATAHVLLPKDYVSAKLTGSIASDPISGVGLVGTDLRYASAVLSLLPRAERVLPPLRDPISSVGHVKDGRPFAGIPVAVGTMDAWAAMFGLGVTSEGEAMYLSGTSEVLGLISRKRIGAPGIITFPDWRGITLHAGPTQSGGASLEWLSRILGVHVADVGQLARTATITQDSPLFLPHLEGERAPIWDPGSKGSFAGLSSATGAAELVASVMEGVAFSARMAIEAIEVSGAMKISSLRHGGGGSASDTWCQIRADSLNRNLERVDVREAGAMGALVLAAAASGEIDGIHDAAGMLVATDREFSPKRENSSLANDRFAAYKELYTALKPLNRLLAGSDAAADAG